MALGAPLCVGRQFTLAALGLCPGLRLPMRGLKSQSGGKSCPYLNIAKEAEPALMLSEQKRTSCAKRRFVACPKLADTVATQLNNGRNFEEPGAFLLEFEPGPGVLTRRLLHAGAHVMVLESNKSFLPNLESLKENVKGQLEVVHCNFFTLDPRSYGLLTPPEMCSEKIFKKLGIFEVPWIADVPLKMIGIVPEKQEKKLLWKLIFYLYECSSIYNYGRIELNLFVSERMYKILVATPTEKKIFQSLSVLWQTACDIHLLHKEPCSSFVTCSKKDKSYTPKSMLAQNEHLYLVRLTPRKDLFTDFLTTDNSRAFIKMIKQCFVKRKSNLTNKVNLWSYENAKNLLRQLEIPEDVTSGGLYPEAYKSLFELMEQTNQINQNLFYSDDLLEDDRSVVY